MRAKLIVAGIVVVAVLLAAAAWLVKRWFEKALYAPGSVRAGRDVISPLDPPPGGPDAEGFVDVGGGVRLYTFEKGAGRRVLLLHGGPGYPFARAWSGLEPLASRYAFLYYDQRGCGRSTRPFDGPPGANTWERIQLLHRTLGLPAQIADMERMRRTLGQEQLVLIGHSFGGLLAALYAAEFPEHVQGLVLVCPAPLVVMPAGDGDLFEEIRGLLPASERERYAEYVKRAFDFKAQLESDEAHLAALNRELGPFYALAARARGFSPPAGATRDDNGGWVVPAMYLGLGRRHDWSGAMAAVTAPALVLHGEHDLQDEAATRRYLSWLPEARIEVIQGAGHFPFEEQPEAFAAAVGRFLDDL